MLFRSAAGETSIKKPLNEKQSERIKGLAAAVENYGNFFGQNIFLGNSGVLLIQGTLAAAGYEVTLGSIAQASIPVGIIVTIFTIIQVLLADRKQRDCVLPVRSGQLQRGLARSSE